MLRHILSIVLAMPVVGAAADFWQAKDPAQWTESEIRKLRTNSPWARECRQLRPSTRTTMNKLGETKTTGKQVGVGAGVQLRWESAAPVLATVADAEIRNETAKWSSEFYVVSVGGLQLPKGYSGTDAVNDLKESSSLGFGSKALLPNRVEVAGSEAKPVYLLLFPRAARIEDLTRSIVVEILMGKTHARATFDVQRMVFKGKVTL